MHLNSNCATWKFCYDHNILLLLLLLSMQLRACSRATKPQFVNVLMLAKWAHVALASLNDEMHFDIWLVL